MQFELFIKVTARIDQTVTVDGITAKEAAHGVGDKGDDLVPEGADIVAALHGLGDIVPGIENSMYRDILVGHLGGDLVLEAVDVNENTVQLLLVGFELLETLLTHSVPHIKSRTV